MKSPRLLDMHILRALKQRDGDLSYIKEALAQVDSGMDYGFSSLCWSDMTRKDVWNCTKPLVDKGLIKSKPQKYEATTRDNKIYEITETGIRYLAACECVLSRDIRTTA